MPYEEMGEQAVKNRLSEAGRLAFEQMRIFAELEASTSESELAQIRQYIALMRDGFQNTRLGCVVALGRTDDDGFKSTYMEQGDIVCEVIEALCAQLLLQYPLAAPTIYYANENWTLEYELAICRKSAMAIRDICELAGLDEPEAEEGEIAKQVLTAVQPVWDMINKVLGPEDSQDCEVHGCLEVVLGWVGGQP